MRVVPPTPEGIAEAAQAIRRGEVAAYPTETVYGLAVDPFSEAAVERLFRCKGRHSQSAVLLIVADESQLAEVVAEIPPQARRFMELFWPGPLSLLFPKSPKLPAVLTAGSGKVCVRCPACDVARELCAAVGHAITSTSANPSGEAPALAADTIRLPDVSIVLDGGTLAPSPPSTVFDPATWEILREGAIPKEDLLRRL